VEDRNKYKFQFFKDIDTDFKEPLKVIHEISHVKDILCDEFILDCNCCFSSQQLAIIESEYKVEHELKISNQAMCSSSEETKNLISDNFKYGLKAPIFLQIKKLLEAKINEASMLMHKIIKEKRYKSYLINTLINLHFNKFLVRKEFLCLINIYSRSKYNLLDERVKEKNLVKASNSCNIIKKWSCFFEDKFLLNFIIKMDSK
jgi:hypothetical protein